MKKIVALLLALVMMLSVMSFATAEEEPFVLTVMLPDFYATVDYMAEDNPVIKAIEEATGVRLEITWAANSTYNDTLNTTLTDEVLPNLMVMTDARGTTMVNNARAGAFHDLTDYVKDSANYPNLAGDPTVYNNISIDGRIYGIYRTRAYPRAGIYYRTDIAKEVGFDKEVKTIDDLKEGMVLPGIVTNITNFGCFVDVGIKENGLVHVSQLCRQFVSDPTTIVSIHQHVQVKVVSIDRERKRIGLTMILD